MKKAARACRPPAAYAERDGAWFSSSLKRGVGFGLDF
jgi:hypothetical protein